MKGNSEIDTSIEGRSKVFAALQAAIPFSITTVIGTLVSAVVGLFVYANSIDFRTRDVRFLAVVIPGILVSLVFGYIAARRAMQADPDRNTGPALSLLKKYRRDAAPAGTDHEAGQYNIGEQYLRELLGRRGA